MTPEQEQAEREAFEQWYAGEYQCRIQKNHYSRIRQVPYVQHLPECAVNAPDYCDDGTEHCDCGRDAALA